MVKFSNPFKRAPAQAIPRPYRVLFTRGDDVMDAPAYRGQFESALARALPNTGSLSDDVTGKAYAVSMTAYACTEYRASTVSTLPLEIVSGVKGADDAPLAGTPLEAFLSVAPRLLADWTRSHLIFGRTYIRKRYNASGFPTALQWLNPLDVYEYTHGSVVTGYRWTTPVGGGEQLALDEVIYTQAFDARPNGNGLSKFEAAWLALNIEASLSTFAAAFFVNGAQPDGFLSYEDDLTDDQWKEAKAEWQKNMKGAKNAHKTAVLPGKWKWTPITAAVKDLAMSELKGGEREDICAVFEVDPALVHLKDTGDPLSASSTYSAIEVSHIRNVALPFVRGVILSALNDQWALRDFTQPYRLDIDEAKIPALVEAQFVRADTARALTDSGVLDYDEGRALLGYAPRDGYMIRKPDQALALWQAGAVTLNDVHTMVSGEAPLGVNGNVLLIGGALVPVDRLREYADANVDKLKAPPPAPFGAPTPGAGLSISTPPTPALPEPAPLSQDVIPGTAQRSQQLPLQLAVDLGGNTFVRYARRLLSDALTTQGINGQWVDEGAWRVALATCDDWNPAALSRLIKSADYGDVSRLDARITGFTQRGGALYATVDAQAESLFKGADLDLGVVGLTPVRADAVPAILLGTTDAAVTEFPPVDFPVVLSTVGCYLGDERYHAWTLRAASVEQLKELLNWQRVVVRKGRAYAFRAEVLPQTVRDFLQVALADGEDTDTAFAEARTLLSEPRAYADTEAMFIREITDIIGSGQDGTFSAQKLGGQMRSIVRRAGLMALRDGFNTVGADPESFDQATLTAFRQWQELQSGLVSNFVQEVTKQGITREEVTLRAQMWANRTLESARELGISLAKPDALMMWVEGGTHDKCDDCVRLDKQVHPMSKWIASGWTPTSGRTACKSFNCLCQLKPTDQPESGNF